MLKVSCLRAVIGFTAVAITLTSATSSKSATIVPCGAPIELETWTAAGSPYLINCDVQIDSVTIQPGVTVLFLSNSVMRVTGFLRAHGSAAEPVVFTSTNPAVKWQGIFFQEVVAGSVLDHCIVENSANSGLRIEDSTVAIRNCVFRNNTGPQGGGMFIDNQLPGAGEFAILNSIFVGNTSSGHGGGVNALMGDGRLRMIGCTIATNTANPASAVGSYVGGGVRVDGNSEFLNCLFIGNRCNSVAATFTTRISRGGGVYSANGNALLKNCVLTNNVAAATGYDPYGRGGAIYTESGSLTNINCIIAFNNTSGGDGANGAAVFLAVGPGHFLNCTIVHNDEVAITANPAQVKVQNSILYFNNAGNAQTVGVTNICFSDVQGGVPPGPGNKSVGPSIGPLTTNPATCLRITASSQCVDMGDPDAIYNDLCFPPSRGTSRNDMGAHGGPGACCWDAPCECPIIGQVQGKIACAGMNVTFCATVTGQGPLSYQWRYHGTNASGAPAVIPGATNQCLSFSNVQPNEAGYYSVHVSNPSCGDGVESNPALLIVLDACVSVDLYAGLSITGQVGRAYCVQYTTDLSQNPVAWTSLTNFTLTTPYYFYRDPQPARHCDSGAVMPPRRFYRVIEGSCP